jgi:hypothetical protein
MSPHDPEDSLDGGSRRERRSTAKTITRASCQRFARTAPACCRELDALSVTRVVTTSGRSRVIVLAKLGSKLRRPQDAGVCTARRWERWMAVIEAAGQEGANGCPACLVAVRRLCGGRRWLYRAPGAQRHGGPGDQCPSPPDTNPVGWLLLAAGLCLAVPSFDESYARYTLVTAPGSLPGAKWFTYAAALAPLPSWLMSWHAAPGRCCWR